MSSPVNRYLGWAPYRSVGGMGTGARGPLTAHHLDFTTRPHPQLVAAAMERSNELTTLFLEHGDAFREFMDSL